MNHTDGDDDATADNADDEGTKNNMSPEVGEGSIIIIEIL